MIRVDLQSRRPGPRWTIYASKGGLLVDRFFFSTVPGREAPYINRSIPVCDRSSNSKQEVRPIAKVESIASTPMTLVLTFSNSPLRASPNSELKQLRTGGRATSKNTKKKLLRNPRSSSAFPLESNQKILADPEVQSG